jgi:predicted amidophosphoribosyltransferase
MTHSPEPICPSCGEDRPQTIDTRKLPYGLEKFCNTCSHCWRVKPDVRDVRGVVMTEP